MRELLYCCIPFLLLVGLPGCVPPSDEQTTDVTIDLKDPLFQQIHTFQDAAQIDSLRIYLEHNDATYRYMAAMAFGSIRSSEAMENLSELLRDPAPEVRAAAAYALGQIGDAAAEPLLIAAFAKTDTAGVYKKANRAILEALGKCGSSETLSLLSTISTYQPRDTALLEGQAYGIYRYALRNIPLPAGTSRMVQFAADPGYPESVRYIAANYLARAANIVIDSTQGAPLTRLIGDEPNANIRMALAIALGKMKNSAAMAALLRLYEKESDYRVKCNILRALGNYPYADVQPTVLQALRDPQVHVATRAAQFFTENGTPDDATLYWRIAKDSLPWQTAVELYTAALRHLPATAESYRNGINYELRRRFAQATSPYHKAAALRALGEWGWNFRFIQREGFVAAHPAVRAASVETLANLCQPAQYRKFFGSSIPVAKELSIYLVNAIQTGDPAMVAIAAGALRIPERNFKTLIDSIGVLETALNKLELPRETETYHELAQAIAFLQGKTDFEPRKPTYNNPIDWEVFKNLSPEPKAVIRTKHGDITIRLLRRVAPGTVINFVKLARDGFYDGKNFHRIVSNFVIQGGCPRGDGYGSLDYSIRSELPQMYYDQEGLVGMASAGNHTEGTQFFITHSPAPHLDGNYTIFARVISGMDVVHKVRAGDLIDKVLIQ